MMMVEWNALAVGDAVMLHVNQIDGGGGTSGTVKSIQATDKDNDLVITVVGADASTPRTVQPTRFQVHADNAGARALCPWCARHARGPAVGNAKPKQQQWVR